MTLTLTYQNPTTGIVHDITHSISGCSWRTRRVGGPAALELKMLSHPDVNLECGGIIALRSGANNLFYGYIFKLGASEKSEVSATAYDQMRYLKNKETYVFKNQRADQILRQIGEDFKLRLGEIENTRYVIPSLVQDGKTLVDIILTALDYTLIHTGEMYTVWDDFGLLRLSSPKKRLAGVILGDASLVTKYAHSEDIDSSTYNKIKLVQDNKATGKRDVYLFQNSDTIRKWGILQEYEKVDDSLNPAQIKERGDKMIALYNRPKRGLSLSGISDISIRAGMGVFVRLTDIDVSGRYVVDECRHDLIKNTMEVKLLLL